jgi:hypothetical protein
LIDWLPYEVFRLLFHCMIASLYIHSFGSLFFTIVMWP